MSTLYGTVKGNQYVVFEDGETLVLGIEEYSESSMEIGLS